MKDRLEIDPEIRGLLEEIAADPRSAIRLAPRRALRQWFERGEAARTSDMATTKAEKHLIEAYREEVADLLYEASLLSFWKAPVLGHRTLGADGRFIDPLGSQPSWQRRAGNVLSSSTAEVDGRKLLEACLGGIPPNLGFSLAKAAMNLAPSGEGRYFLALNAPWDSPHFALILLGRAKEGAHPTARAMRLEAARLCAAGDLVKAREAYLAVTQRFGLSTIDLCYALNLSCAQGDLRLAIHDGEVLNRACSVDDPNLAEARDLIRGWSQSKHRQLPEVTRTASIIASRLEGPAQVLLKAYEP